MNTRRSRSRAQSLVEFALVGPIFFMMLFGVIEMGRLIWTNHELANGTREGARWAMVRGAESGSPATVAGIETRILNTTSGLNNGDLSVSATGLNGLPGTTLVVTATYNYDVLFGMIPGLSDMTLEETSTVQVLR